MNSWENAFYLILAKQNIDSLLFLQKYYDKLYIYEYYLRGFKVPLFYLNICYILEVNFQKKKICNNSQTIKTIFEKRDKNYAHKDKNYKYENVNLKDLIATIKKEFEEVNKLCINDSKLPQNLTIKFVAHDRLLYRLLYPYTYVFDKLYVDKTMFYISDEDKSIEELKPINLLDARQTTEDKTSIGFPPVYGVNEYEVYQNKELLAIKWEIENGSNGLFYEQFIKD